MTKTNDKRWVPITTIEDETTPLVAEMQAQVPFRVVALDVDGKRLLHDSRKTILPGQSARIVLPPEATKESIVVFHVERLDGKTLAMPALAERIAHAPKLSALAIYPATEIRCRWSPDFVGRVVGVRSRVVPSCGVCGGSQSIGIQKRIMCPECLGEGTREGGELRVQSTGLFVGLNLQALAVSAIPLESLNGVALATDTFLPGQVVTLGVRNDSLVSARVEVELECEIEPDAPVTAEARPS